MIKLKTCTKCKIEKEAELNFNKKSARCKSCVSILNKEYEKTYRVRRSLLCKISYKNNNREDYFKKYREENRLIIRERVQKGRDKNREWTREYARNWWRKRRDSDVYFKISRNLRTSLFISLKTNAKKASVLTLLDCSIDFFKLYIESRFEPGMTWENWGKGADKWNLDHILPCELFNFSDIRQQKLCYHFLNFRPIWETENLSKNDSLPNGKAARSLSPNEKLNYLKELGFSL